LQERPRWLFRSRSRTDKPDPQDYAAEVIQRLLEHHPRLSKTQREIQELEKQLKVIVDDQGRLRANLREMPPTAEAYKRYLKKFDEQETQIETYQTDIKKLQAAEHNQKKEFDDFLVNFSAE